MLEEVVYKRVLAGLVQSAAALSISALSLHFLFCRLCLSTFVSWTWFYFGERGVTSSIPLGCTLWDIWLGGIMWSCSTGPHTAFKVLCWGPRNVGQVWEIEVFSEAISCSVDVLLESCSAGCCPGVVYLKGGAPWGCGLRIHFLQALDIFGNEFGGCPKFSYARLW